MDTATTHPTLSDLLASIRHLPRAERNARYDAWLRVERARPERVAQRAEDQRIVNAYARFLGAVTA